PLGLIKSISRLPIIPGNTLVNSAKLNFKSEIPKATVSFLIINTLNSNDTLYKNGKRLGELLKKYFPKHCVNYYEVRNKTDFIRTMNENPSTFFIFYGHGSMPEMSRNQPDQIGKLHIGDDEIDMIELENTLKVVPVVTILGACQTQVLDSHYLNIGNMFLGLGSQSVLATYFPVDGYYTFSLIESIFRNLNSYFEGTTPRYLKNWADIILQSRRTHYITEPINTIIEYLGKKGVKCHIDSIDLGKFVMEYCIKSSS
ncbi:TPA: CHAT domain-containing protein, partial [Streptococcus suis]|nr:CHAT domain-containing protein [Streptococcus suis]